MKNTNNPILSTEPNQLIGLDLRLSQIYSYHHLTPREEAKLFKDILQSRSLIVKKQLQTVQIAIQQPKIQKQLSDFLNLYLTSQEIEVNEELLQEADEAIIDIITNNSDYDIIINQIDLVFNKLFDVKIEDFEETISSVLLSFLEDCAKEYNIISTFTRNETRIIGIAKRSRDRLLEGLQQYVVSIARKSYLNRGLELEDLIQEGNLGLMKAADRFDPSKGFAFSTYATNWIKQSMGRACTNTGYLVRIPCHMYWHIGKVHKIKTQFLEAEGREPSVEEIISLSGLIKSQVTTALEVLQRSNFSLDTPVEGAQSDGSNSTMADFIADVNSVDPLQSVIQEGQYELLIEHFDKLTEQEKQILSMRLDLEGRGKPYTQKQVCAELGINKTTMTNIQDRAYNKLRGILEMKDYA